VKNDAQRLSISSEDDQLAGTAGDPIVCVSCMSLKRSRRQSWKCTYDLVASLAPFLSCL
jgi:hypothetical protein